MKLPYSTYEHKNMFLDRPMLKRLRSFTTDNKIKVFLGTCYDILRRSYGQQFEGSAGDTTMADIVRAAAYLLWKHFPVTHYFIAPGVARFCVDAIKGYDDEYYKSLPECRPVTMPCTYGDISLPSAAWLVPRKLKCFGGLIAPEFCEEDIFYSRDENVMLPGCFALHFPAKEGFKSLIVFPNCSISTPPSEGPNFFPLHFVATDGENVFGGSPGCAPPEYIPADVSDRHDLVLGLSLYMSAFPDAVVSAKFDDVKHLKHYGGRSHYVDRNEVVDEDIRRSVSPHWRKGYWKVLRDARFVNKRGQLIHIRGTMVKGKALEVLDDAPGA